MGVMSVSKQIRCAAKAMTRQQAFNHVATMLDINPTSADLQDLLLFFAPPMPKVPKTAEDWVAKAVDPKDLRVSLQHLYSDGERLIGCDGHVLLYAPTKRPVGYYCRKTMLPVPMEEKYPDVDRVIPKDNCHVEIDCLDGLPRRCHSGEFYRVIEGLAVNEKMLNLAFCCGPVDIKAVDGRSIKGRNGFGEFVLMGAVLPNED